MQYRNHSGPGGRARELMRRSRTCGTSMKGVKEEKGRGFYICPFSRSLEVIKGTVGQRLRQAGNKSMDIMGVDKYLDGLCPFFILTFPFPSVIPTLLPLVYIWQWDKVRMKFQFATIN